jgi:lipopolysaccharide exporter
MAGFKLINLKGDLFATTFCFAAIAVIRLGSSLTLTRILRPEAYGIITIITSIAFVVELIADTNVTMFIIRDENGEQPRYLNTAWTLQFFRAVLNTSVLMLCGPLIASSIYHLPALSTPLRVYSLCFLLSAMQSMAFPLAIRRKQARLIMYSELAAAFLSTAFSIVYCLYSRDYWGMIYGMLLSRIIMTLLSRILYPAIRPIFQFDRGAAKEILGFSKFTMPSSLLTLSLSQFDKIVFLRLFDLRLLGVYGLAGNIASSIEALITKISQSILYPRCAHNFRTNPDTFSLKYYTENAKLFTSIMILPAAVGGAAQLIIAVLYPVGYVRAGVVLQAFMLRAALLSLAAPAEDLLIAAGEYKVILHGNVFRVVGMCSASLSGYYFFGFVGFVYGAALSGLPPLVYYFWLQRKKRMMIVRYEFYKAGFAVGVAVSAALTSWVILHIWPSIHLGWRSS